MTQYFSLALLCVICYSSISDGFIISESKKSTTMALNAGPLGGFFQELDNFMDDAFSRRLGNGAAFYGKRKSSFYGKNDKKADPSEDYQGPTSSGFFKWMEDEETGRMIPVTRRKNKNIERSPSYWDRVYAEKKD